MAKRGLDIIGAVCGLIVLSPLFLLLAVVIKLISRGPVLFKQQRVGYKKQPFICFKFRTMKSDVDSKLHEQHIKQLIAGGGPMNKIQKDPRVIPIVGHFMRKTSLDELPQLINVLFGNMSLVGPRPCLSYEVEMYSGPLMRRFDVLPGMTGLWQVSGKNKTTLDKMAGLDVIYVERCCFMTDIQILLKTLPVVVYQSLTKG